MATKLPSWRKISDQIISTLPPEWKTHFSGKVLKRIVVAFSLSLEQAYGLLDRIFANAVWETSRGEALRQLARSWGMETRSGVPATVAVEFTRFKTGEERIIPKGTTVATENSIEFSLADTISFPAAPDEESQTITGVCEAKIAGRSGNIFANQIVSIDLQTAETLPTNQFTPPPVSRVEASNPAPASGGEPPEDDEKLRSRLSDHLATLHRATPEAIAARLNNTGFYPEIRDFRIEQIFAVPGYFRVIVLDSAPQIYTTTNWIALGNNQYEARIPFTELTGVIIRQIPSRRIGIQEQTPEGLLRWRDSQALPTSGGNLEWRVSQGKLQVYLGGIDPNTIDINIYGGLFSRIYSDLEENWVASGVQFDIIPPRFKEIEVRISYLLESGFDAQSVRRNLTSAISDYLRTLKLGEAFQLEFAFAALNRVNGAFGVLVESPSSNVLVNPSEVILPTSVEVFQR